jgi:hypothetical protein
MGALPAIARGNPNIPEWILRWDPTYTGLVNTGLYNIYDSAFQSSVTPLEQSAHPVSHGQLLNIYHQLIYESPQSGSWLPPHLVWGLGAIGAVLLTAYLFKRYRNAVR